jgi:putative acetyltransferase
MSSMSFAPVTVQLADGRRCTLRAAAEGDDAGLYALEQAIVRARDGVVKYPDELPPDLAAYAEKRANSGAAFALVAAQDDGELLGEASLVRLPFRMLRHVAVLGMGVHPRAQSRGLGRALLTHLLAWARDHRDLDGGRVLRVELYTRADNHRALALYHALGFRLEGTRRAFVLRDDGALVDDHMMALLFA